MAKSDGVYIDYADLYQLEYFRNKMERYSTDINTMQTDKKKIDLIIDNFKLKIKIAEYEKTILDKAICESESLRNSSKNDYEDWVKRISDKYGLPDKWSYLPETGEVVLK